ncbi:MAG: phenylalanine--tRNA ligase subunit beta [Candidatus Omnitrophica bacterium]|nr:phenylalanine--tRNA ligase subunit beta [Candidatus Omnitrophota bacterium]
MKVSIEWLRDYATLDMSLPRLVERLTMVGLEVVRQEKKGKDTVLDIEVTPNRPDCLGLIGIAREVAAFSGKPLKLPKNILSRPKGGIRGAQSKKKINVRLEDLHGCSRYSARVMSHIEIKASPAWMSRRLEAVGIRSINNVVDISNYVLMEYGQPLHCFDLSKLKGSQIVVRRARAGEKIVTIDEKERELDASILVIANERSPVAIAGIMGGLDSEISASTTDILIESAHFDPVVIRRASRALGLSSDSSYRFERGVDVENVTEASDRAAFLITELAGGQVEGDVVDVGAKRRPRDRITLRMRQLHSLLGTEIPGGQVKRILSSLGCAVAAASTVTTRFVVNTPSHRPDLKGEHDLIEEVARVWGYDRIPTRLPYASIEFGAHEDKGGTVPGAIRAALLAGGVNEVITHSLVSREALEKTAVDVELVPDLRNPLSSEQEYMRPWLLTGLLKVIQHNSARRAELVQIFEEGKVYSRSGKRGINIKEAPAVGMALSGSAPTTWRYSPRPVDYHDLRGHVDKAVAHAQLPALEYQAQALSWLAEECSAKLFLNSKEVGWIGKLSPKILQAWDLTADVWAAEILLDPLKAQVQKEHRYQPVPRFPTVVRDVDAVVPEETPAAAVEAVIRSAAGELLESVTLFDVYRGKSIPSDRKSMTFSMRFLSHDRTLTEADVEPACASVHEALRQELGAEIRGAQELHS